MKDVMLDLETLGTTPGSVILQIGAVAFDRLGGVGERFSVTLSDDLQRRLGMTEDPETKLWWAQQPREVQDRVFGGQMDPKKACMSFADWWREQKAERVWSHGAAFDVPLLEALMRRLVLAPPWHYRGIRDTRTLFDLYEFDTRTVPATGLVHEAVDDCLWQIRCVHAALGVDGI